MTTYDSIPYPSYSYPQTAPAQIGGIAKLFGLAPQDIRDANILEIGCASGGNLLPLAARFEGAKFTGIDASKNQIAIAEKTAEKLGLDNVTFVAASITEHDFGDEKFDYIIVHGVYSWVPEDVQAKILEICGNQLSDNGVAYISYNTLPGWNAVKTVRDMMLYHAGNFENPAQKVVESRNMLKFVSDNMQAQSGPYKQTLEAEINTLQNADNNYLLHDHLENVNAPCYFHEFASRAAENGLAYLGDTELQTMYLGNHGQKVVETLGQITDTVRLEQYLDFVNNRRFRMSVMVKSSASIKRNLTAESLEGLGIYALFLPTAPIDLSKSDELEKLEIVSAKNKDLKATITGKLFCAVYTEIVKALPNRVTFDEIVENIAEKFADTPAAELKISVGNYVLQSIFKGIFSVTLDNLQAAVAISEKPEIFPAARIMGQTGTKVSNINHETLTLADDKRVIMQYVSGENTIDDIIAAVKKHVEKGELNVAVNGAPVTKDADNFDEVVKSYVINSLQAFYRQGLLVA